MTLRRMLKKRFAMGLVILLLIAQYSYGLGFMTDAKAASIDSDQNIITSVSMAVYGPDGQTVTGDVYEQGAEVKLNYTWSLPDGHGYQAGDTFTFQLPEQFKLYNDIGGALESDEGDFGTFTVSQATHQVTLTFNEFIQSHDNIHGTLNISTRFDKDVIKGSTVQQIYFPVNGDTQVVVVRFKPDVASTIDKQGTADRYNATSIHWSVDVNKTLDSVYGASVSDPIPSGLTLDPVTVAVYQLDMQLDGAVNQGILVDPSQYELASGNGTLSLHFKSSPITGAYRLMYTTDITDLTKSQFTNTATFSGTNLNPVTASSTVKVLRAPSLKKYDIGYDRITQTVTWKIEYNYNYGFIPQSEAALTDLFNNTQILVDGSVKVYNVNVDANGTASVGSLLVPGTDYTLTPASASGKTGFVLQFLRDVTTPYDIQYQTKPKERLFEAKRIYNTVTSGTYKAEYNKDIFPVVITKTADAASADYVARTVNWKITLNEDSYPMSHVVVKDVVPYGGLTFLPDTLVVTDAKGKKVPASAYTLDYDQPVQPGKGFTLSFNDTITGKYTISYKTKFDFSALTGKDKFYNTSYLYWDGTTGYAIASFDPRSEVKNNGFKTGEYNAVSKEITWSVGGNYNGMTLNSAIVVDKIESPQKLVPGSVKVKQMYLWSNGNTTKMSELNVPYTVTIGDDNILRVSFQEPVNYPFFIEFKTSLEGQLIDSNKADNSASVFDGDSKVSGDLTASVTIPHGGDYVSKSGSQSGDKLNWTININRGQSYVKDAKITDTGSPNQLLLADSFHLYPTVVSPDGTIAKSGPELVKGTDYTLDIVTTDAGKQTFVLSFLSDIRSAYILEYQSLIAARSGEAVTNKATLSGNNVIEVTKETSTEVIVGVSSGSGTGIGSRGTLTVQKLDETDHLKLLAGAEFNLYRLNGDERLLIGSKVTGEDGKAVFNGLLAGSYAIVETKAPEGYTLDATEHAVSLGAGATITLPVTNKKLASPEPSASPTPTPTPTPTPSAPEVTESPTPTPSASTEPSVSPSSAPSEDPSAGPSEVPASAPPAGATATPTAAPTGVIPTASPTPSTGGEVIIPDDTVPIGPAASAVPSAVPSPSAVASPSPTVTPSEVPIIDEVPSGGVDIPDEDVPKGGPENPDKGSNPASGKLPKTGEGSSMPIYMGGLGLILIGLVLNRWLSRRRKS
ncbi:LPXTG cell wall anchor domain-containing protein [Paenibacillus sp. HN-1]|uniref:collagen binding domain-containing protein n=1 Tax=Paenibacillus TaxID=44249 RepID=UPI001CA81E80|nr:MULTISPECIES: collagen binding domain-containing protein [Paenibacillus]MBY9081577.1 LPXTG cell wall anchor domain-containing protein [Paenibacillus sp. CGMCC 1.18879]MBY9087700.1 LPXTG cell wall anchor domain-containing protein [Paenibacillus sinensis]